MPNIIIKKKIFIVYKVLKWFGGQDFGMPSHEVLGWNLDDIV
jgi:hypothetical protein